MSDYGSDYEADHDRVAPPPPQIRGNVQATPQQETTLVDLKARNTTLRQQLQRLNTELDQQLTQHGQKITRVQPLPKKNLSPQEKLVAQNEALRRKNNDLSDRLHVAQTVERSPEMHNELGSLTNEWKQLQSENKSLENIYENQMVKITVADQIEEELKQIRAQHNEEVRQLKETTRRAKDEREQELGYFKQLHRQLDRLEEKLRVQESAGQSVKSLKDMQQQVEEKDHIIESLKYQVAVLSRTNVSDKKRARMRGEKIAKELEELREEHQLLTERLNKRSLAEELHVK